MSSTTNHELNTFISFTKTPKILGGIDTLYCFAESNENYDNFFVELCEEIDIQKQRGALHFSKTSSIHLDIQNVRFTYTGQPDGYHYFKDEMEFVYIGFKDTYKQRNLHDIRIRLQANGIYTLGIVSLLAYVDSIIAPITTGNKQITRIDVNAFVQVDFSGLSSNMFATKKRFVRSIYQDIQNTHRLQTLYVGKPPFRLRIYDKRQELSKSKKSALMYEYLLSNGMQKDAPLWNIEFEMHREFLREFRIFSVDDALKNAENLFRQGCDYIRLIDTQQHKDTHKHRAPTLPIWQEIQTAYSISDFMQIAAPLERVKKRIRTYQYADAFSEALTLAWKMKINGYEFNMEFLEDILHEMNKKDEQTQMRQQTFFDAQANNDDESLFTSMSNDDLLHAHADFAHRYVKTDMTDTDLFISVYKAYNELTKRGLTPLRQKVTA